MARLVIALLLISCASAWAKTCDDTNCFTCNFQTGRCKRCEPGWGPDKNGVCKPCQSADKYCDSCGDDLNTCWTCVDDYSLNTRTGKCVKIGVEHCQDATGPDPTKFCTKCLYGYDLSADRTKCVLCPQFCQTCSDSGVCSKCYRGWGFDPQGKGTCVLCPEMCKRCHEQPSAATCTVCRDQPGWGLDAKTKTCKRCTQPNCTKCNKAPDFCTQCNYGYTTTPDGTCKKCPPNCLNCSGSVCTRCDFTATGYFGLVNGKCQACPPKCNTCDGSGRCTSCDSGYGLDKSKKCIKCADVSGCDSCDGTAPRCSRCTARWSLAKNGTCVACKDQYCVKCKPETPGKCLRCSSGPNGGDYGTSWGLDPDGACSACLVQNCASCNGDTTACTACMTGYTLKDKKTCVKKERT